MQSKLTPSHHEDSCSSLPTLTKSQEQLRRVYSDVVTKGDDIMLSEPRTYSKPSTNITNIKCAMNTINEVDMVQCECCGMSEECTPTYIRRVKGYFSGKWVCGICSEAVNEQMKREPLTSLEKAMESHMSFCKNFNKTIRLNPKLSLVGAMRDIARKSSQHRSSIDNIRSKMTMARTVSCGPWITPHTTGATIQ